MENTFCIIGDYHDNIDEDKKLRNELEQHILKHGGKIVFVIDNNLKYLVVGEGKISKSRQAQLEKNKSVQKLTRTQVFELFSEKVKCINDEPTPISNLLVDKYSPRSPDDIIGNMKARKLLQSYFERWKSGDFSGKKRAILLCGPPGIGKSTMATIYAQASGFQIIEMNASDTRSRASLRNVIHSAVATLSMTIDGHVNSYANCIIMDEVDGMSGGDVGGAAELVKAIQTTKTPIICICNDRNANSVKTLKVHCECIDCWPPTQGECLARLKFICGQEGLDVSPAVLKMIATESNGDMRHCLVTLGMMRLRSSSSIMDDLRLIERSKVDQDISPFVSTRSLLGGRFRENKMISIDNDDDMLPLFIAENYLSTNDTLDTYAQISQSIALADVVDATIQSTQQYSLRPVQSSFATFIPSSLVKNGIGGEKINFPKVLANLSTAKTNKKRLFDLSSKVHVDETDLHYIYCMFVRSLADGVDPKVICERMTEYGMTREDIDELCYTDTYQETLSRIQPSVKRKLTSEFERLKKEGFAPAPTRVNLHTDDD
uniref:AAA+ ATPase domain-containing protein n=1 Tax=viral metagenome TaxID=1070528 RepID=A0A6C0IWT6_9ZZZZ